MASEAEFRVMASELTAEANSTVNEEKRDRLLQRASHYVRLAENEGWLHANSLSAYRSGKTG